MRLCLFVQWSNLLANRIWNYTYGVELPQIVSAQLICFCKQFEIRERAQHLIVSFQEHTGTLWLPALFSNSNDNNMEKFATMRMQNENPGNHNFENFLIFGLNCFQIGFIGFPSSKFISFWFLNAFMHGVCFITLLWQSISSSTIDIYLCIFPLQLIWFGYLVILVLLRWTEKLLDLFFF